MLVTIVATGIGVIRPCLICVATMERDADVTNWIAYFMVVMLLAFPLQLLWWVPLYAEIRLLAAICLSAYDARLARVVFERYLRPQAGTVTEHWQRWTALPTDATERDDDCVSPHAEDKKKTC